MPNPFSQQTIQKWFAQKDNRIVLAWLIGGLILRCIIAYWLYPGFDEAYYYLYSLHLDWSYFDHPVLVALTTGLGVWLTGVVSQFTLRIGTLILYTGSLWLLYLTGVQLFGKKAGQWTLAIASVIPIFTIGFGVLTMPDSSLIFFWSATLYCAACEFFPKSASNQHNISPTHQGQNVSPSPLPHTQTEQNYTSPALPYQPTYRLALLGILVGLTCLGKYHGFILGVGLWGFVLTSSRHRRAFASTWTYLGIILFILTLFPLWYWNAQHDWVSFRFQLSSRFEPELNAPKPGYNPLNVLVVFLSGLAYLFPTMGIPLWWVTVRGLWLSAKNKLQNLHSIQLSKTWLILCISLPVTLGFTLLGGKEQILAGWPMPGFWGLTLLLGERAANWEKHSRKWIRRWLWGTAFFLLPILFLALLHLNLGTLQKPSQYALFGGFIAPKNDPSRELIDTSQLQQGFVDSPVLNQALQESSFVATNAYYLGGLIGMALIPVKPIPIVCFSEDMRGFATWSHPEEFLGKDGLYITLERFHKMEKLNREFSGYFTRFVEIGTVPLKRGGAETEVFHVYRVEKMLKPYPRSEIDALANFPA
ncbi:glycosyltransferase family 39 protein [Lusitaniella coriacea LEGE 07157]|uniref:Glycosyltransferase family 39 protein n=1 Tax=Lusitaniella coriacea LEGE 07157 TaxID=945747 RepID=A0A8J7AYP2_9CYAN|nr:glycosyltransferase family 39 protein [Lusitaniella coriacea]MBE9115049.1 glycosyltransferase family 39 protein [Lusitaniella coriacea LEGE 07157]